jgi:Ca-activated chloride channel family protein
MQFVYPHFLWLLLLLPAFGVWQRRRRRAALRYPAALMLIDLPAGKARRARAIGLAWRLAILGLLIVALARPRLPDPGTPVPVQSLAMVVVLDVSGSMAERDYVLEGRTISRLDAAKYAFQRFLSGSANGMPDRTDTLVGLVTFAARAEDVCPPTLSHAVVLQMLDAARPLGTPPDSSTNIGDAVVEGLELARSAKPKEKVLILLSDGEHNVPAEVVPDARKPREAAHLAKAFGVRIHTIFVGPTSTGDPEAKANAAKGEHALQDVAAITGGKAFRAADTTALTDVCQEIDQLERTRIESFQFHRYLELYPWLGLACIVLYMAMSSWEGTRWLRIP